MELKDTGKMKVISIDFDNTIWCNKKEEVMNKDKVEKLFEEPFNMIVIYTARSWSQFDFIKKTLDKNHIPYHAIVCGKLRADVYIDDLNNGGLKW